MGAPELQPFFGPGSALDRLGDLEDLDDLDPAALGGGGGGRGGAGASAALAATPADLDGCLLEPEDEAEGAGPTMMSREARALFLAGGGEAALQAWKERYYTEKLEMPDASGSSTRRVVAEYIRGLHWVLQYYYRGVASWDWFYPHHYAPMAQDMRQLGDIDVSFSRGRPFRPFEQLLAVLPAASATLLPPAFQPLMLNPSSPILDFYPEKFDVDMEGKRAEWEGVVKVPFIDEARLVAAAASIPADRLTAEEQRRNVPGDMLVFEHAAGRHEAEHCDSTLPRHFVSIAQAHSICRHVPPPDPIPPEDRGFVPSLAKGTATGKRNPPGFPTLKTMSNLGVELKAAGVNVFGNPSKKDSLVLQLPDVRSTIAGDAAAPLLRGMLCGRVYVKWPYLQEAEIVAVSDARQRISVEGVAAHAPEEAARWQQSAGATKNSFLTKLGVDVGPLPVMLEVRVCTGFSRGADGSVRKEYARELAPYPLQAVLQSRPKPPPGFADPDAPKELSLAPGSRAVWVGAEHFGCLATVLADPAVKVTGQPGRQGGYLVRVQPLHKELLAAEGRAKHVVKQHQQQYFPAGVACRMLRLHPRMLGRVTGNVWVDDSKGDRVDIGLAVKNAKQGLCVPSLCRPTAEGTGWLYSQALVDLMRQYRDRFPSVCAALDPSSAPPPPPPTDGSLEGPGGGGGGGGGGGSERRNVRAAELFPGVTDPAVLDAKLEEVRSFLKSLPSAKKPLVAMTAEQASDQAVERLAMTLPGLLPFGAGALAPMELEQVHPSLLLPPHDPAAPQSVLAGGAFEPGDRVVVLRGTGAPAFGARGTVVGVMPGGVEVLMDEEYAGGTTLNGRVRGARGGYLPPEQLLNVSKQRPVRGSGPKPRPAAAGAAAAAAARHREAAGAAGGLVTSPRAVTAVATRLVELAPWLKGKQAQHLAAQQHAAAQQALAEQQQQQQQQSAGQQPPSPSPPPQLQQPPHAAAGGGAAAPAVPMPLPNNHQGGRLLQMLKKGSAPQAQQQLPMQGAPTVAASVATPAPAVPQQPPGGTRLQAMLLQAAAAAHQQPPPPPQQAQRPMPLPEQPSAAAGKSLLMKLQRNGSSSGGGAPPGPEQQQQQQQPALLQPTGSAGANLLAMLQKPGGGAPAARPPSTTAAQQLPAQQQQQQQQQHKEQQQPAVRVVPRTVQQAAKPKGKAKQGAPEQPSAAVEAALAAASASAVLASPARPAAQLQQDKQPAAKAKKPKQQKPAAEEAAGGEAAPTAAAAAAAVAVAAAAAAATTPSASAAAPAVATVAVKAKPPAAAQGGDAAPERKAPRTPPAGAGTSLLGRSATVTQARLPDGTRGFTMGRGRGGMPGSPAPSAPGSSGGGTQPPVGAGAVAAPGSAAHTHTNGVGHHTPEAAPAAAAAVAVAAGMGSLRLGTGGGSGSSGGGAGGERSSSAGGAAPAQAAAALQGGSAQALMQMLQRGAPRGSPAAPQPAQQSPALPAPVLAQAAADAQQAGAAAANTSAASNLLRRLQRQQSAATKQ